MTGFTNKHQDKKTEITTLYVYRYSVIDYINIRTTIYSDIGRIGPT